MTETTAPGDARPTLPGNGRPTIALFVLMVAIGSLYLASLGWFIAKGHNFIDVEKTAAASRFAQSTKLALPARLTFSKQSKWSQALATGWNQPENWGVWSSRSVATVILPAIANAPDGPVCVSVRVGTMSKIHRWSLSITVNGTTLAPIHHFSGTGPFDIEGAVPVAAGDLIRLRFTGPEPRIPDLLSHHSSDSRSLGFSLFGIAVTPHCASH